MTTLHRRSTRPFQIKSIEDNGTFSGYGSVFNVKDSQKDMVIKGAFANSLSKWAGDGKLPKMLWQHDPSQPIGVYSKMQEDDHGLYVEGKILIDAGPTERRAYEHLKAGSIDSMSIGYTVPKEGYSYNKDLDAYLIKQINLWEVSLVTFPANPAATVNNVKAAVEGGPGEFERFLRDAGLSRTEAKALLARGFDGLRSLRDADSEDDEEVMKSLINSMRALREGK